MKKYLAFAKTILKVQLKSITDSLTGIFSFTIHILVFSVLWDFVLEGKQIAGYTKKDLIWYVILAEAIIYAFYLYYRKIAYKVEIGDFAYDMTKPYNFLCRTISEGLAELPITLITIVVGAVLGIILAGTISLTLTAIFGITIITAMALILLLAIQIIVGIAAIWLGRDVSSLWLLVQKAMLIFAFTPVELFPKWIQIPLLCLPTTHVIYTPAKLLVHFSKALFIKSLIFETASILVLVLMLTIIYKKGVRKQNVNGI